MSLSVDLNADMGESFGAWNMGNDMALLDIITSANIACGFHAGDPDVMAKTMKAAFEKGVGIGAHPGFPDLQGFGRREMNIPLQTLANMVRYQVGAAQGMAKAIGTKLRHLKLHGALANMAAENSDMAEICYNAALEIQSDLVVMVLAGTQQQKAAENIGCSIAMEIFADRAYNDDATLVNRRIKGAVIHDPVFAAERMVKMVKAGAIITENGKHLPTNIDTICLHGDTPEAVEIASHVRKALSDAGVKLKKL